MAWPGKILVVVRVRSSLGGLSPITFSRVSKPPFEWGLVPYCMLGNEVALFVSDVGVSPPSGVNMLVGGEIGVNWGNGLGVVIGA